MSDWHNIEQEQTDLRSFEPGSELEKVARLAAPVNGRCAHGFAIGSGLCRVRGCAAQGNEKIRTCFRCRRQHTGSGNGRLCDECAGRQRRQGDL